MRVALLLDLFGVCGGGQKVSLEMARALEEGGWRVVFLSTSRENLSECAELLGIEGDFPVVEVRDFVESVLARTGRFVRYRALRLIVGALDAAKRLAERFDAVLIDSQSSMPLRGADVSYLHGVYTAKSAGRVGPFYEALLRYEASRLLGRPKLVLSNSNWVARIVERAYDVETRVLHPPVDFGYFEYDGRKKEKIVVTTSRISLEKKVHLLPRIAERLRGYEWYLVASTLSSLSPTYADAILAAIEREIRSRKTENFHVLTDLERRELRELLLRASYYVHPPCSEHFGIAAVEAMAAGCVPIVYRGGGLWTDVVSGVDHRLGYIDVREIPRTIERLDSMSAGDLNYLRERVIERAKKFDSPLFRRKFLEIVEGVSRSAAPR